MTHKVTQGTWEHLGENRVSEWVEERASQARKGSPKSFSRLHSGADRARCEHGLAVSQAAGWGSFKHGQRGRPAAALGLRLTVAHLAP